MAIVKIPTVSMANYAIRNGSPIGEFSCYREVYKTVRGKYVYKILRNEDREWASQANNREFDSYQKLMTMDLPAGVKVPKMYLLSNGVLVAEFVKGYHPKDGCSSSRGSQWHTCRDIANCWAEKISSIGLRDMHHENVLISSDGTIHLIDIDGGWVDPW